MSILDKDSMTEDHWSNNPRFRKTSMTEEDEEFNRIEREASMRKAAVAATVAKREWVGLTVEEMNEMTWGKTVYEILALAEAKLKEKNT
jgi:hypothetical protein